MMMGNQKAARRAAPNQSPAKRVWFGEEGQRSAKEFSPQEKRNGADFALTRGGLGDEK